MIKDTTDLLRESLEALGSAQYWLSAITVEGDGVLNNIRRLIMVIEDHLQIPAGDRLLMTRPTETDELIQGQWYWVSNSDGESWPAMYNTDATGGWSNNDTYEDFLGEVIKWQRLPQPD